MIEKLATFSIKAAAYIAIGAFALLFLPMTILIYLLVRDSENDLFEDALSSIGIICLAVVAQYLWLVTILEQIV